MTNVCTIVKGSGTLNVRPPHACVRRGSGIVVDIERYKIYYFREISNLGHFGGGRIPMWVMDLKLFQCGSVWLYQTPALSNHSNLALSQTTAT